MRDESGLPEGYKDAIHVDVDIHFDWRDRLRILFGGIVFARVITFCENLPGKAYSECKVNVRLPRKPRLELGTVEAQDVKEKA